MKNKYNYLLLSFLIVFATSFASDNDLKDAQKSALNSNIELVRASVDSECAKCKKKIRKLEAQLEEIATTLRDEDFESNICYLEKRKEKIIKRIKENEDKIDALKTGKMAIDLVNMKYNPN